MRTGNNYSGARWAFSQRERKPRGHQLPGFAGRFMSKSGRMMPLRDVEAADVIETATGRIRVASGRIMAGGRKGRIELLDAAGEVIVAGDYTYPVRVWRLVPSPDGKASRGA